MNTFNNQTRLFKQASQLQLLYWGLVAIWNIAGLVLLSMGQRALGPTASIIPIVLLGVIIAAMIFSGRKQSNVYPVLACVVFIMSSFVVTQAFIKPPELWPSDIWRYAGVAINGLGAVSALLGLKWYSKQRRSSH